MLRGADAGRARAAGPLHRREVTRLAVGWLVLASAAAAAAEPVITVEPLTMSVETAEKGSVGWQLGADGVLRDKASRDVIAKIVKNEVRLAGGGIVVQLGADGMVAYRSRDPRGKKWVRGTLGKLDVSGQLTDEKGGRIWLDDAGVVRSAPSSSLLPRIMCQGVTARTRRTAMLLVSLIVVEIAYVVASIATHRTGE